LTSAYKYQHLADHAGYLSWREPNPFWTNAAVELKEVSDDYFAIADFTNDLSFYGRVKALIPDSWYQPWVPRLPHPGLTVTHVPAP